MSPGQLPDRPPRKRKQPKWPALLLIVGLTLTVIGFVLTVGPLALDLGNTDSPTAEGPTDDPADVAAGDGVEETDDTTVNGDEAAGTEDADETATTGIPATISTLMSGADESPDPDDDENREKCIAD